MDFLAPMQVCDVHDVMSYARYCQQSLGVPLPRGTDVGPLRKVINQLFEENPNFTWQTLCKVTQWARNRKKRFAHLRQLVACWRFACQDGCLPELDPSYEDPRLEEEIDRALQVEKDEEWRFSLIKARGNTARREVFLAWQTERSSSPLMAS